MTSLIQGFRSGLSAVASTVTQTALKGYHLVANLGSVSSIAGKIFDATVLPTVVCERYINDSLKSFSLKKTLEAPLSEDAIKGLADFMGFFFEQINLPFADKLIALIKDAMHKPLKLDEETYASLINDFISPALTEKNVNKLATGVFGTVRQLLHAVAEVEETDATDKKSALLKQLGINTTFEEYKDLAKADLKTNIGALTKHLEKMFIDEKNPILRSFLKLGLLIVSGILALFSSSLSESLYRYALSHYMNFQANQQGELSCKFLGMEFKISKEEVDALHERFDDYKEVLFWYFIRQTTLQLANFEKQPESVDIEWKGLLNELEPILSKTVSAASNRTTATTSKGMAFKFVGSPLFKYVGVNVAMNTLRQIQPSVLITAGVKGLRNGFYSHLSKAV